MNQQLENLYFLRDRVIPWMEANPDRVGFDSSASPCGTYRCLAGWYLSMRHGINNPEHIVHAFIGNDPEHNVERDTGITQASNEWYPVFGAGYFGTLADRKARLNEIIARKEKELGTSKALVLYRPGADIVREMMGVSA